MPNIGPMELIIVLVIVLLIFGAKRLPELGRSLGSGMREFKDSVTSKDDDKAEDRVTTNAALPRAEDEQAPLTGETVRESTPR
jgi:sec-independent protein translocase protein TatA